MDYVLSIHQILQDDQPSRYFEQLKNNGALIEKYSIIHSMIGITQPELHHPEGDVFRHTMNATDAMALMTNNLMLPFCALTHDFGKTLTPKEELPHHFGHEKVGVSLVEAFCKQERVPGDWKTATCFVAEYHGRFHLINKMKSKKIVDLITRCNENPVGIEGLAMIGLADARGNGDFTAEHPNYDFLLACKEILSIKERKLKLRLDFDNKKGDDFYETAMRGLRH